MPKGREITFFEREKIEVYLRMKKAKKWIAKKIGREYSIIRKEIARNSGEHLPYDAKTAQTIADRRKKKTNVRKLEKSGNEELAKYVEEKIREGSSPEQIAGVLKNYPPEEVKECKDKTVSYESIYDWVYNGKGKKLGLYIFLRRKQNKRISKKTRKERKNKAKISLIPDRVSVHKRELTEELGHWETDSVIFTGRSILSVQFERKSKLCRMHKCEDKSARRSEEAIWDSMETTREIEWKTITRDNGSENVLHIETEVPSFFCDPYCSWQKGGVENLNGLIREYFPKKTNLDTVPVREIYRIQEKLNNRPRKCLNFLTPNQILAGELEFKGALNS